MGPYTKITYRDVFGKPRAESRKKEKTRSKICAQTEQQKMRMEWREREANTEAEQVCCMLTSFLPCVYGKAKQVYSRENNTTHNNLSTIVKATKS